MPHAFYGTTPNLNRAVNELNRSSSLLAGLVSGIQGVVGGIVAGSGVAATNEQVEKAVQWAVDKASNNYITYSNSNRNLKNPAGISYDCSSFVITAFYVGGIDVAATSTRDMRVGFLAKGFTWIPGTRWESSQLQRGDILLKEDDHTQMYIGNNQDVNCGNTPARVMVHSVDNYGRGWDGILRLTEQEESD